MSVDIRIRHGQVSHAVGSCSACDDYQTPEGAAAHEVTTIRLGGTEVRVCRRCESLLKRELRS